MTIRNLLAGLAIIALILSSEFAYGQKVQVELYTGFSFTSVSSTEETAQLSFNYVPRIPICLLADFALSENILFETGLGYSPRGAKILYSSGGGPFGSAADYDLGLTYIEIPAVFVAAPGNFRVFFGFQFSFISSATLEGNDISDAVEGTDFGLRYGLGWDWEKFGVRLTGQNGLNDIYKHPSQTWTSSAYTLSIGYFLVKMRNRPVKGQKDKFVPEHRKLDR